tara:strand:+ start:361 stop:1206 length:846 start_codon:yes stop_codon:yes gene_type:complete
MMDNPTLETLAAMQPMDIAPMEERQDDPRFPTIMRTDGKITANSQVPNKDYPGRNRDMRLNFNSTEYRGDEAIAQVEALEGFKLNPVQRDIVKHEGFVDGLYYDTAEKPVLTTGVGQTGTYLRKPFVESFNAKERELKSIFPKYGDYSYEQQTPLMSLHYRGDTRLNKGPRKGKAQKWTGHFKKGEYAKAAKELLNHKEYEKRKAIVDSTGKPDGVVTRLELARDQIRAMEPQQKYVVERNGEKFANVSAEQLKESELETLNAYMKEWRKWGFRPEAPEKK